ncbi:MAG: hypothetical protein SF028_01115 [Candidatus Sumerlaeia bacterium]|nr:hypothetical protein [Candidatus Sumerlaeia bacterium]
MTRFAAGWAAIVGAAAATIALLLLTPGLFGNFWQDDFLLLYHASEARLASEPWLGATLWLPHGEVWRPVAGRLLWRFIEGPLGASPVAAGAIAASLWTGAAALAGLLAARLADGSRSTAAGAAALFAAHPCGLLPLAWPSATQESLALAAAFGATLLALAGSEAEGPRRRWLLSLSACVFGAGLLCKESVLFAPILLGACLLATRPRLVRADLAPAALAATLALLHLASRHAITFPRDDAQYAAGGAFALLRNAAAMTGHALGVSPFLWHAGTPPGTRFGSVALSLGLVLLAGWTLRAHADDPEKRRRAMVLAAGAAVLWMPYVLLRKPPSSYYPLMGLALLFPLLAPVRQGFACATAVCVVLSMLSARAPLPAPLARAAWAAEKRPLLDAAPKDAARLWVLVASERDLATLGWQRGVAWIASRRYGSITPVLGREIRPEDLPPGGVVVDLRE